MFFQEFFTQCPVLGWLLLKPLLKCFLAEKLSKDSAEEEKTEKKAKKEKSAIRSVH
jgi:hypothetical protein